MDAGSDAQGRGSLWRRHLLGDGPTSKIFSAWEGKLDESNQRVIRADAERTRSDMEFFRQPALRDKMEAMLTCWCQERQIKYKQGLNEVLAPFLYLQAPEHQDLHETPSDDEVFDLFVTFVRDYTPFFSSDEFVPLQCAFVFFRRLLLYHRPDLHNLFVEKDVTPDMFCMPWFLTLFASKTPMRLAIQLWDRLLERGEPYFIIFLAAAVLVLAEKEILTADRSALPEILTSLGVNSREDLESLWGCAEVLFMQTPATFLKRVRRVVLKADEAKVAHGQKLLESVEKEGCFFILPEEVLGHCYPTRPGEELRPWQPSSHCPWRLLLLDLRPVAEFEAERLPAAVHLDLASLLPQAQAWASGRKLLQWGKDSAERAVLQPSQVFEVFKETLGENWICDSQAHICLLGRSEDSALVRHLYKVLTQDLTLRHISVASGGFEAVMKSATKHGYEIVRSEPGIAGALDRQPVPAAAAAAEGAAAAAAAAAETAASKLSAVLSSLKRVTAGPRPKSEPSPAKSEAGNRPMSSGSTAAPAVIDRPGNWPEAIDLGRLPRRTDEELSALRWRWSCVALAIRPPEDVEATHREGQCGCSAILFIQNAMVVCALPISNDAAVLTEFSVHRVTKVTSKKSSPQTVTLFQEERSGEQVQTTLLAALYFLKGTKEVEQFVSVLQSQRQNAPRPRTVATVTKDEKMHSPLSPPPVALEAAAVAVAAAAGEGAPGEQEGSCQNEDPSPDADTSKQEPADADQPTSREQQEPAGSSGSDAPDSDQEEQTSADPPDCAEQEQAGAAPADSGEENLQDPTHADPADCGEQDVQEQARADVPDSGEQEEQADSADSCDEERADADPPGDAVQET